jgi:hypothetical protein
MPGDARCAIITPYYKEERQVIERCIASVKAQTVGADHILIADGHPQDWIDGAGVRHLKLDRAHGDYGNTPRSIGAMLAISEGCDAIGMLDADNWLEPTHVATCLGVVKGPCDYVIAQRILRRPDGSVLPLKEDVRHPDVDTNQYFFLRGAFAALPHWAMMPKPVSMLGDVFMSRLLRQRDFVAAHTATPTVNYSTLWEVHYRAVGEAPPPGAKPSASDAPMKAWLASLSPRENEIAGRLAGYLVAAKERPQVKPGRNDRCPCGSGKKFKHCHGA